MKKYMIAEIIQRAQQPGYEFREREKQHAAMITLLCCLSIGLAIGLAFLCRSCSPDPVAPYSLCEECGEIIWVENAGRCLSHRGTEATELASNNPINPVHPVKKGNPHAH